MKIEDLKTGMLILDKQDALKMVVGNIAIGIAPYGATTLENYTFKQNNTCNSIQKIFAEPKPKYVFNAGMEFWLGKKEFLNPANSYTEVLWEAKPEEMTMDEICKELGREIKIVKSK